MNATIPILGVLQSNISGHELSRLQNCQERKSTNWQIVRLRNHQRGKETYPYEICYFNFEISFT